MATYNPQQLGIKAPAGGFQNGGWYNGRQYYNGTLSDVNAIHPESSQQGAGQQVSSEVRAQSAAAQGVSTQNFDQYLINQSKSQPSSAVPTGAGNSQPAANTPVGDVKDSMSGFFNPNKSASIDVNKMYEESMNSEEIKALNTKLAKADAEINAKKQAEVEAEAIINDNPFYAEATRQGKVDRLQKKVAADIQVLINERNTYANDLTNKKADAQTKLNIALKQYDIESNEYQQNLAKLNTLISTGAISGASANDIAGIANATGMSTSMINSIINKVKQDSVKPHIITSKDDNGNVTVTVLDLNTGNLINQSGLGAIAGTKSGGSGGLTATQTRDYLGKAIGFLGQVDKNYQTVGGVAKQTRKEGAGDKRVSAQEFGLAYDKLLSEVGDRDLAAQIINQAFTEGGFKKWGF